MGIVNKLTKLRQYVVPEGIDLLEDVLPVLLRYSLPALADQMNKALYARDHEQIDDLLNQIQLLLNDHFRPTYGQEFSFDEDRELWLTYFQRQRQQGNFSALEHAIEIFPFIFDMAGKRYCGALLDSCPHSGCGGFFEHSTQLTCPKCGHYREFCRKGPHVNGRCRMHGGEQSESELAPVNPTMSLQTTLAHQSSYQTRLPGRLGVIYDELARSVNYPSDHLSLLSEIILLRAKVLEAAENLAEFDPIAIEREIDRERRRLNRAMDREDYSEVKICVKRLNLIINEAAQHKRNWDGVVPLIVTMARLSQIEQERIIKSKRMVSTEELSMVVNQTVQDFLGMFGGMTNAVQDYLNKAISARMTEKQYARIEAYLIGQELNHSLRHILRRYVESQMRGEAAPPDVVVDEYRS